MKKAIFPLLSFCMAALFSCNNAQQQSANDGAPATAGNTHSINVSNLFQANCASCHDPLKDATGPAMKGALARWENDRNGIKAFIKNSAQSIASGNIHAKAAYDKYAPMMMTPFPGLSDAELDALIDTYMK